MKIVFALALAVLSSTAFAGDAEVIAAWQHCQGHSIGAGDTNRWKPGWEDCAKVQKLFEELDRNRLAKEQEAQSKAAIKKALESAR